MQDIFVSQRYNNDLLSEILITQNSPPVILSLPKGILSLSKDILSLPKGILSLSKDTLSLPKGTLSPVEGHHEPTNH